MATKTETKAASAKPVPEDPADPSPEDAEAGAGMEDPGEPKHSSRKPTKMNTGSDDPGDDDDEPEGDNEFRSSSERSSARTSELRRLLERGRPKAKEQPARQRASLGTVKIETFHSSRRDYKAWKKLVEAQQKLYSLEEGELSMLIYLSAKGEARDTLDQMEWWTCSPKMVSGRCGCCWMKLLENRMRIVRKSGTTVPRIPAHLGNEYS